MTKERSHSFKGKIVSSAEKQKKSSRGGKAYIELPKGIEFLKLPDNAKSVKLDFLPYIITSEHHPERDDKAGVALPGTPWYRLPVKVHIKVGANNEAVICPRVFGKKCPICEYQVKRIKEGADKEEFKLLYPQERSLYIVIPVGVKDLEEKPYVWDMSDFLFQETLIEELQEDPDNEDFFTLEYGKTANLRLKWKEIGKSNFPEIVSITFEDREPYGEEVLDDIPSLDDCIKVLPYADLEAKFFDLDKEEDAGKIDDREPDEGESKRTKRYGRQEKKEEPEQEPEPQEETPPRRSRNRAPEPEPEPEEEKPARSSRKEEKSKGSDKCPHGHKFGEDTDKFPKDCDKCQIWDDCIDVYEKNRK